MDATVNIPEFPRSDSMPQLVTITTYAMGRPVSCVVTYEYEDDADAEAAGIDAAFDAS